MRLTPSDLERAVSWMEARWGKNKKWDHVFDLYEDFANFTPGALMEALHGWYRAGNKFAPGPAELRAEVARVQKHRVDRGEDLVIDEVCEVHKWAAPDPWDTDRRMVCAVCSEPGPKFHCPGHVFSKDGRCWYCTARSTDVTPDPEPVAAGLFEDDEAPF